MPIKDLLKPSLSKVLLAVLVFVIIYSLVGYCLPIEILPLYHGPGSAASQIFPCGSLSPLIGRSHSGCSWRILQVALLTISYFIACAIITTVKLRKKAKKRS